jgi:hypothetical protein
MHKPLNPSEADRRSSCLENAEKAYSSIASFDVVSGRVMDATVGDTRTELDCLSHVQHTIATDPHRRHYVNGQVLPRSFLGILPLLRSGWCFGSHRQPWNTS